MTVAASRERRWFGSTEILVVTLIAMALAAGWLRGVVDGNEKLATAGTVFCGVFVQAVPFLALGVIVSGLVATFVTPERLARWLPNRPVAAVAVAGVSGAALPGCECGSVPVARRLYGPGSVGAAALTFMLSAPAINPVVLVSTAVAFPGQPKMVLARAVASLLTAMVMGMVWSRWGRDSWVTRKLPAAHAESSSRWTTFTEAARHDFLQAASYLAIGAVAAAALHVLVPAWVFEHLAGNLVVGVVTMALLAVVLALCSEADAFVAASITMMPLIPRLVFLVVGPAVDVKLVAMQSGMFGRAFAARFAPLTFVVATIVATGVGVAVLGDAVKRDTENTLLILLGVSVAMIAATGTFTRYVKPGLLPWLALSAVIVIGLGLAAIVRDVRRGHTDHDHGGHGDHTHKHGATWFLVLPIVLLIFIVPPALSPRAIAPANVAVAPRRAFPPLPPGDAPTVPLPEVLMRIAAGSSDTLAGRTITVTGFTLKEGDRTDLAKIVIVCCAADAQLARLQLTGPAAAQAAALPENTWVSVTGMVPDGQSYRGPSSIPAIDVLGLTRTDPPKSTY